MALPFSPITQPFTALVQKMKSKLEESLGKTALPKPQGPPPSFNQAPNAQLATQAAMASVFAAQQDQQHWSDAYSKGTNDNMRMHLDLRSSDPDFQLFSKTQRAVLIGFRRVRKWKEIPNIWKTIESTRTEEDMRTELARS